MNKNKQILTSNLRDTLKAVVLKEVEQLTTTLENIEPTERVNILCKLMPYVFPKVETINCHVDEPINLTPNW